MTDPTGKSFLSYRRSRAHEAALLINAQHRLGIPTWLDTNDLAPGPTEPQIQHTLAAETTANAVLWLTPDVAGSDYIQKIEAPRILDRATAGTGFFCLPVAAGGLDYQAAAGALDPRYNFHDLRTWNLHRAATTDITDTDAAIVATKVLHQRLQAICRAPASATLKLRLTTLGSIGFTPGLALDLDWRAEFKDKEATSQAWTERLLPALKSVGDALGQCADGRHVEASGQLSIAAAAALGLLFRGPRHASLAWHQWFRGHPGQVWSLAVGREPVALKPELTPGATDSDQLAVLIAVAATKSSVRNDFNATAALLPPFRAKLELAGPDGKDFLLPSAGAAYDCACQITAAIKEARDNYPHIRTVHLFLAVPTGLAVLMGQLFNQLPEVQFYEHIPNGSPSPYKPAFKVNASVWPG